MKIKSHQKKGIPFNKIVVIFFLLSYGTGLCAQKPDTIQPFIDPAPFQDNTNHWYSIADKHNMINALPDRPRYKPTEIRHIADNMILFQKKNGGWPKNYDFFAILSPEQTAKVKACREETNTTFDNGSTYTQISALATAYRAEKSEKYKTACIRGLEFILRAQYQNGGWPQYFPLEKNNYSSHITYNDGAMTGVMQLLKNILDGKPEFDFVDNALRLKIEEAYNKGIDCILKTQISENGKLTAWCQQHDEGTLQPAWARKFEPPCICNKESANLVMFLMSINHPSKEIIEAIQSAVSWFKESQIYNTRIVSIKATPEQTPYKLSESDRIVKIDSTAPPIWTRYYELKTHRPLFCNRDSKIVYSLAEVERERRDGYGWYTYEPQKVLDKYPAWKKKWIEN